MDDFDTFERSLAAALRSDADLSVGRFEPGTIARAAVAGTQRRPRRVPWGLGGARTTSRWPVAAALLVGLLVIGGAFLVYERNQSLVVANPSPTPTSRPSPSLDAVLPPPSSTPGEPSPAPTSAGFWIATGSTGAPRRGDVAVRLLDGRVLVVGGAAGGLDPSPATLYDPESASWSATGTMAKPRDGSEATLLRDGRVLVADEVYDPISGTWSATGKMVQDGDYVTATLLRDGRVLATGTAGCELYDPDIGTWTKTGTMVAPRYYRPLHVLLPDGRVLVAGGLIADRGVDAAEIYDPATGTWTAIASMHVSRADGTATLLPDGRVLVTGGADYQLSGPPELYDPVAGTWTVTADLANPGNRYQSAALLPDGKVLVTSERHSADAELFDPATASWSRAGSMLQSHPFAAATPLLDGTVLVAGGDSGWAELYVPAGVSPPSHAGSHAEPVPSPSPTPTPTAVPTPVPPAVGPVPPAARRWTVRVVNRSSRPATLFVAEEDSSGMTRLVGRVTPDIVPPAATVMVTFFLPGKGVRGWSIFVNPGPDTGALLADNSVPLAGEIRIGPDGQPGWLSP